MSVIFWNFRKGEKQKITQKKQVEKHMYHPKPLTNKYQNNIL